METKAVPARTQWRCMQSYCAACSLQCMAVCLTWVPCTLTASPAAALPAFLVGVAVGAAYGGAVSVLDDARVKVHNCSFNRNSANFGGGMLLFNNSTGTCQRDVTLLACCVQTCLVEQVCCEVTLTSNPLLFQRTPKSTITPCNTCVTRY